MVWGIVVGRRAIAPNYQSRVVSTATAAVRPTPSLCVPKWEKAFVERVSLPFRIELVLWIKARMTMAERNWEWRRSFLAQNGQPAFLPGTCYYFRPASVFSPQLGQQTKRGRRLAKSPGLMSHQKLTSVCYRGMREKEVGAAGRGGEE